MVQAIVLLLVISYDFILSSAASALGPSMPRAVSCQAIRFGMDARVLVVGGEL
ncbi:hypothetical protein PF007_g32950 [Phytophthora fragariae]|uniref:Uncharacterized protein n=1 Tax=Phytophthora fragariae TaxID=53985 RepID=A0A6A3PFS0_9STRA|nr:hypothetical protein PF007_g32950 [Phytophthora fragariae]